MKVGISPDVRYSIRGEFRKIEAFAIKISIPHPPHQSQSQCCARVPYEGTGRDSTTNGGSNGLSAGMETDKALRDRVGKGPSKRGRTPEGAAGFGNRCARRMRMWRCVRQSDGGRWSGGWRGPRSRDRAKSGSQENSLFPGFQKGQFDVGLVLDPPRSGTRGRRQSPCFF